MINQPAHIIPVKASKNHPEYAYSMGLLKNCNHPEIIIFSIPFPFFKRFFNEVFHSVNTNDQYLLETEYEKMATSRFKCIFKPVLERHFGYFPHSSRYGKDFKAVQMFWSDKNNNLPWEKGFKESLIGTQPFLFQ